MRDVVLVTIRTNLLFFFFLTCSFIPQNRSGERKKKKKIRHHIDFPRECKRRSVRVLVRAILYSYAW
ncbi:hypothetical protein L873DRAFT_874989 [Choiromyces venosus 120613-1]|uniref:Uncharacterized protein n=1 Tax=Choiromyces venosus 120613-1 TaxID=1336337 RepID=A0A3N4K1F8_9PEZI|nr:hypothetical protein L873DRAFT_874989 [Choiromyces venosus 120613-1]